MTTDLAPTMSDAERNAWFRAQADEIAEQVDDKVEARVSELASPGAQALTLRYAAPIVQGPDMQPVADVVDAAFDRMRYAVENLPKNEAKFDTAPLIDLFDKLVEVIKLQKEETTLTRQAMSAHNELLAKLVTAWTSMKPAELPAFNPQINAPESPTAMAAIAALSEQMSLLLKALDKKAETIAPRAKRRLKIVHGEKESTVSEE